MAQDVLVLVTDVWHIEEKSKNCVGAGQAEASKQVLEASQRGWIHANTYLDSAQVFRWHPFC
jgi:hypothetical protein